MPRSQAAMFTSPCSLPETASSELPPYPISLPLSPAFTIHAHRPLDPHAELLTGFIHPMESILFGTRPIRAHSLSIILISLCAISCYQFNFSFYECFFFKFYLPVTKCQIFFPFGVELKAVSSSFSPISTCDFFPYLKFTSN